MMKRPALACSGYGLMILIVFVTMIFITLISLHLMSGGTTVQMLGMANNNISARIIAKNALKTVFADMQSKLDNGQTVDASYRYPAAAGTYANASVSNNPQNLSGGGSSVVGQYWGRVLKARGDYYLVEATGIMNGSQVVVTEIVQMKGTVFIRKGVRFVGRAVNDYIGNVTAAGDVDNDGYNDFLIGYKDINGGQGEVYLIFGRSPADWDDLVDASGTFNLSSLSKSTDMIRFTARGATDELGSISAAGDLNNDGYDDFAMAAPEAGSGKGEVYIIFGRPRDNGTTADWESFSNASGVFSLNSTSWGTYKTVRITHTSTLNLGAAIGGVDLDQDGFSDLIIGAPLDDDSGNGLTDCGGIFIVFGRSTANWGTLAGTGNYALNAYTKAQQIIRFTGNDAGAHMGAALDRMGAGDVDNDGYPDFVAGNPGTDGTSGTSEANIFFGRPWENGTSTDWNSITNSSGYSSLRSNGGAITNQKIPVIMMGSGKNNLGRGVSTTGDLDGDGYDDVVVGMPRISSGSPGKVYILFGRPWNDGSSTDWESLGGGGANEYIDIATKVSIANKVAVLISAENNNQTGYDVSIPGDVNNDGTDDLLFGSIWESSASGFAQEGLSYLFSGRPWSNGGTADWDSLLNASASFTISGSSKANKIMRFKGEAAWDEMGYWCRGAGDVNGDGVPDFLMDADSASSGKGNVYLIFGRPQSEFDTWVGTNGVFSLNTNL